MLLIDFALLQTSTSIDQLRSFRPATIPAIHRVAVTSSDVGITADALDVIHGSGEAIPQVQGSSRIPAAFLQAMFLREEKHSIDESMCWMARVEVSQAHPRSSIAETDGPYSSRDVLYILNRLRRVEPAAERGRD